jgi:hypothetical protein
MDHTQNHRALWEELDALVLAEVEALDTPGRPVSPQAPVPPVVPSMETVPELDDPPVDADPEPVPRDLDMFDGEEQEVIARTSAWLRNRPNRDMIIDALWSAAAGQEEQKAQDASPSERPSEAVAEEV